MVPGPKPTPGNGNAPGRRSEPKPRIIEARPNHHLIPSVATRGFRRPFCPPSRGDLRVVGAASVAIASPYAGAAKSNVLHHAWALFDFAVRAEPKRQRVGKCWESGLRSIVSNCSCLAVPPTLPYASSAMFCGNTPRPLSPSSHSKITRAHYPDNAA